MVEDIRQLQSWFCYILFSLVWTSDWWPIKNQRSPRTAGCTQWKIGYSEECCKREDRCLWDFVEGHFWKEKCCRREEAVGYLKRQRHWRTKRHYCWREGKILNFSYVLFFIIEVLDIQIKKLLLSHIIFIFHTLKVKTVMGLM